MSKRLSQGGFTLIEMLIAVAILAGLAITITPRVNLIINQNKVINAAQSLSSDIYTVRSNMLGKTNTRCFVVIKSDGWEIQEADDKNNVKVLKRTTYKGVNFANENLSSYPNIGFTRDGILSGSTGGRIALVGNYSIKKIEVSPIGKVFVQ